MSYFLAQRAAAQQSHNDVYNPVEQHQYVPQSLVVGTSSGNTAINLASHNNEVPGGANRCRNCGWFTANWHEWPMWDGKYGPH